MIAFSSENDRFGMTDVNSSCFRLAMSYTVSLSIYK